nr:hypothetical protein [Agrobacterium sp. rho-13.3]MDX8306293.1 hypothetical protein [Agrobacterium sp. rho-13.3]MDX8307376.1 hypothetical protein [Agrobacterium sp. rho-13.3]
MTMRSKAECRSSSVASLAFVCTNGTFIILGWATDMTIPGQGRITALAFGPHQFKEFIGFWRPQIGIAPAVKAALIYMAINNAYSTSRT